MGVLFVCDHVFVTQKGNIYSNTFSYTFFKRYVDIFSDVTVIARSKEESDVDLLPLASGEGVEFIFLENISTFSSFFGLRQKHRKFIKSIIGEYDGVIVRIPTELGLLVAEVARENNVKCMIEVVGCAWDAMWNYGGLKSKIYAPFLFMKMKSNVKKSDYVTYVTERFLQEKYPPSKKARVIGVSDVDLSDTNEKILLQRIQKIEALGEKIVFGTIGSLTVQYKGIDIALQTLAKIDNKQNNFEYRILGGGDPTAYKILADKLGIGDKVHFDGTLPREKAVFDWLDSIDIYLQPSLVEGLPRSLIEAMSRGCPSIGSSVGGIPELLDKKMLFSPSHPEQFSEKIQALINDKKLMIEASTENFNKAKQYQKNVLDEKRNKFWLNFREDIVQQ